MAPPYGPFSNGALSLYLDTVDAREELRMTVIIAAMATIIAALVVIRAKRKKAGR
jgi:hypothetical protein